MISIRTEQKQPSEVVLCDALVEKDRQILLFFHCEQTSLRERKNKINAVDGRDGTSDN